MSPRRKSLAGFLAEGHRIARLGYWEWTLETGELRCSEEIPLLLALPAQGWGEGWPEPFLRQVHPEDRERVREKLHRAASQGEGFRLDHRLLGPGGEERIVHQEVRVSTDAAGRPQRLAGTVQDITEWPLADEELQIKEAALASSFTPFCMADLEGRLTYVNESFLRLWGYGEAGEALGRPAVAFAADPAQAEEILHTLRETGSWVGEIAGRRRDGELIDVEVQSTVVLCKRGIPLCLLASLNDVTERNRTAKALAAREAELFHVLESIDEVVYRDWFRAGEATGPTRLISPQVETMLGYPAESFVRDPGLWRRLLHRHDRRRTVEELRRRVPLGETFTLEYRLRPDGTRRFRWIEDVVVPELDAAGEVVGVSGTLRDITARKRTQEEKNRLQEEVRAAAEDWQETFDSIDLPIFLVCWEGRIRRQNRAAEALVGRGVGRQIDRVGSGGLWGAVMELIREVRRHQASRFRQVEDGAAGRTWQLSATPTRDEVRVGERRIVLILRDVTDLARLQESLRRSEQMSAMGALVARVAHEVRNPLFGISATVDALEECFGEHQDFQEFIEVLREELDRMAKLMVDLLDYGKSMELRLAPGSLAQVIDSAVSSCDLLGESKQVSIRSSIQPALPAVAMASRRLEQVFKNLLENALQHSPPGGEVWIRASRHPGADWVECTVEDQGPGFPPEDLDRLTEPFFSRRPGGTGLGLSIVQRILDEHGGRLQLGDHPRGGGAVSVRLPVADPPREPKLPGSALRKGP